MVEGNGCWIATLAEFAMGAINLEAEFRVVR